MISVIVPFYNSEKYLRGSLSSILSQTHSDFELLCIDDGSKDSGTSIVKEFMSKDKRVKLFRQLNQGRSSARNFGLSKAKGEFICFVDSDDILPSNSLELLFDSITKFNSDASVGTIRVKYDVHQEMEKGGLSFYTINREGLFNISDELISSFHCSSCASLYRKEIVEKYSLRYPEGVNYEGAFWHWCYFSVSTKVSFVSEPVYFYIRRPDSIMSKTFEKKENVSVHHLYVVGEIINFMKDRDLIEGREEVLLRLLEIYFGLALEHSQKWELLSISYECELLLKHINMDLKNFDALERLKAGDVSLLFSDVERTKWREEVAIFKKYKKIISPLLPLLSCCKTLIYFRRFLTRKASKFIYEKYGAL